MVLKIPPPPLLTGAEWQAFNRWLLELQSILSNQGGIDPSQVSGLEPLFAQVATNTANIATLETGQGGQATDILALQNQVNTLNTVTIPAINGQLTSLGARNQVFNGIVPPVALHNNGDWFADTAGKHIYVQVAGAWVLVL